MFGEANEAQVLVQNPLRRDLDSDVARRIRGGLGRERFAREIAQIFRRLARPCIICPPRLVVADICRRGFGIEAGDIEFLDHRRFGVACEP